jgi:serine/threonine protein kinase
LLSRLLQKDRAKRIGYQEIITHPWIQELKQKKFVVPIEVKKQMNFDRVFLKQEIGDVNTAPRCLSEELNLFP